MGFDDLFENKNRYHGNYGNSNIHDYKRHGQRSFYSGRHNRDYVNLFAIIEKIKRNPKLKRLAIIAVIVVLVLIVITIIILLPLLMQLFDYISQNGIQGVVDGISGFLDKIWKGSAK